MIIPIILFGLILYLILTEVHKIFKLDSNAKKANHRLRKAKINQLKSNYPEITKQKAIEVVNVYMNKIEKEINNL